MGEAAKVEEGAEDAAESIAGRSPTSPTRTATTPKKGHRRLPRWARQLLLPFRYKVMKGGRGGAKSHTVIEIQLALLVKNPNRRIVFIREIQNSIKDSVKALIEDKIIDMGLQKYFKVLTTEIRTENGTGVILFKGMNDKTKDSLKSMEGIDCAILEEAHTITKTSIDTLFPTIRKEGSEIWAMYNPQTETDPIHAMFCGSSGPTGEAFVPPEGSLVINCHFKDNPHASETMKKEAERCRLEDPDNYAHIWDGETEKHSEARILKKLRLEKFDTPEDIIALGGMRFGCDWGFSIDPLVLIGGWVRMATRQLFVRYLVYEIGCEIEDTKTMFMRIPGVNRWWITAGRDRPERVRSACRQGLKVKSCIGGNGSKEEGVEYLQNFEIIVHPEAALAYEHFKGYKHPIDKHTGAIIPVLPTKKDDVVEAATYMLEDVRRFEQGKTLRTPEELKPLPMKHGWNKKRG